MPKRGRRCGPSRRDRDRIEQLEARIAKTEQAIRDLEQTMATPGFYDDRAAAQATIDRHQSLMWEVGDLMGQWESLQRLTWRRPRTRDIFSTGAGAPRLRSPQFPRATARLAEALAKAAPQRVLR